MKSTSDKPESTEPSQTIEPAQTVEPTFDPNVLKIAITHCPVYNDSEGVFEGAVYTENGAAFDTSAYYIVGFLTEFYIKPYYNDYKTQITDIYSNGKLGIWSLKTYTGASDRIATIFHFFLVPAEYFVNNTSSTYSAISAAAIDFVEVTRNAETGEISISPDREVPRNGEFRLPEISEDKLCVNIDLHTGDMAPGSALSDDYVEKYLKMCSTFASAVRFFDCYGENYDHAYAYANSLGLYVVGSAYLDANNRSQHITLLDRLIARANAGEIDMACISSEAILRGDIDVASAVTYLQYVRAGITDRTIPVVIADSIHLFVQYPELAANSDVLFFNSYPMWENKSVEIASASFIGAVESVQRMYPDRALVCSETGWSCAGETVGDAEMTPENAARYYSEVREYSLSHELPCFWFSFTDNKYKAASGNELESHFGFCLVDEDGEFVIKQCYAGLEPFRTNNIKYSTSSNKITVEGLKYRSQAVDIPSTINGKPTTFIRGSEWGYTPAFKGHTEIEYLQLPNTITEVGRYAFEDTAWYKNEENWENGALYAGKCIIKMKSNIEGSFDITTVHR